LEDYSLVDIYAQKLFFSVNNIINPLCDPNNHSQKKGHETQMCVKKNGRRHFSSLFGGWGLVKASLSFHLCKP
jgi:hypothetical protein